MGEAVVHGESEFGTLALSGIVPTKGAELGGMFPADAQTYIVMQGGASNSSKQPAPPVIRAEGMER